MRSAARAGPAGCGRRPPTSREGCPYSSGPQSSSTSSADLQPGGTEGGWAATPGRTSQGQRERTTC
eukprot:2011211-Pyramimonas_sp.AAC.1